MEQLHSVIPDNRNRIALGLLAEGVSRFDIIVDKENDTIILKPYVDIPRRESWLYKNKGSFESVKQGIEDIKARRVGQVDKDIQSDIDDEIAKLKNEI